MRLKAMQAPFSLLAEGASTMNPLAAQAQAQAQAAQGSPVADPLGDVAAQVSGPVIEVVGKSISGGILLVVPIVGAVLVFSIIVFIITSTFYLPPTDGYNQNSD
jgi:hypothetical protein